MHWHALCVTNKQEAKREVMIKGAIKTMDILKNPVSFIGVYGIFSYIRLLAKCLSPASYLFLNIMPK